MHQKTWTMYIIGLRLLVPLDISSPFELEECIKQKINVEGKIVQPTDISQMVLPEGFDDDIGGVVKIEGVGMFFSIYRTS